MDEDTAARKMAVNTTVAFVCMAIAGHISAFTPDGALAFTISSVSISVAAGASMFTLIWLLYWAYHNEQLDADYDPLTRDDIWHQIEAYLKTENSG